MGIAAQIMDSKPDEYQARIQTERSLFEELLIVHDLPGIYHYWSDTYIRPKLRAAGYSSMEEFFSAPLAAMCAKRAGGPVRFLSIGAGNCDTEIEIAGTLRSAGHCNFVIDCLDLNPTMLQRGGQAAQERGVGDNIAPLEADFNDWHASARYDGVLANQALHHVLNLEGLFAEIKASLWPDGCFVISEMIGRNGHVRWPEALAVIHEFWCTLPPAYRYNWQLRRYEPLYQLWDCSTVGFEGIRAQDILPLLVKDFHFDRFIAFGSAIDPFVDRSFGHNFSASNAWDRAFIDEVHARDEADIRTGRLTPTHMFAVVDQRFDAPATYLDPPSPAACIRDPQASVEPPPVPGAIWPRGSENLGRVLAEMERRIQGLESDLSRKCEEAENLHQELIKRTHWAWDLEKQLQAEWDNNAAARPRRWLSRLFSSPKP